MSIRQINLRLSEELIAAIDQDCVTDRGRLRRQEWIEDAVRRKLGLCPPVASVPMLAGQLKIDDVLEQRDSKSTAPSRGPRGRPDLYEQGQQVRAAATARRATREATKQKEERHE